jgi:O-antigen/teichoic acid export membrane protein
MLKGNDLMMAVGRYSILMSLAAPIYIFASGEYHDGGKLAVAILTFVVILTTYMYWRKKDFIKKGFWRNFDRLIAASLVIIPFVLVDQEKRWDVRTFLLFTMERS